MSVGSFVTTKRHEPTTLALPIEVPELKCDTCKAKDATALCMGCYGSFCFDCFTKHRQKVSRDFGNLLWEHELFEALFKPYSAQTATVTTTTTSATASARKFDPLSVLAQIDSWEQDLESRIKTMAAAARQNVKSSIDERHDAIFWHYPKITDDLRTIQQAKRYVDRERSSIKETLCDINNNIESSSNTPSLCFRSEKIDLTKTMKLVSTRSGTERRPSTAAVASSSSSSDIARQPLEFANLSQPNEPFEKVERLGGGTAIGASDKFIIYTDIDEKLEKCDLCMIELSNKYRVVIPLAGVVDICWCAEADYFVILTKREVYTFNPNRKQLDPVYEIQPPNKTQFRRCTYAVAAYMGCVGNDLWLERLKELADEAGLITSYQEKANLPTGKCAVLITQNGRSMVADPGASHHFSCDYLDKPDSKSLIENAKIICCEETKLFAKTHRGVQTDDIQSSINALIKMPKLNELRPRTVVLNKVFNLMATKSPSNSGAGSNIPKRKQNLRFSDIGNLPHQTLLPIDGYQHRKLLPLELALKSVTNLQPNVDQKVEVALHNCLYLSDNLTQDESAAIQIYTMEWAPHETCVYYLLNQLLRLEDREPLKPWFNYLKLILTGLYKLASFKGTVWRGVKLDLSREYPKDKVFIWWGFSSCTESLEVLQSEHFLGKTGHRTLFSIECLDGKEIQRHSYLRKEREILLLPGRKFRVKGLVEMAPNAHVIQLIEIIPKFPLLADPFVTSEPVLMGGEKRTTSTSLLSKPGYFTADDRDGSRSTVEEIITQHRSSAVVEIYRQQLNNRDMELLKNELRSNESWSK
ncbi:unnamed protein product, partial [Didymodactylos carnosus]